MAGNGQFFGGRQNFPNGGFSQQAGYRSGPVWGSMSQSFDSRGVGSPATISVGADHLSSNGHGASGSFNVVPGVGGQGSLRGQVGIINNDNHQLSAFAQHDRFLTKDLKPIGPATNTSGLNYTNANGTSAFATSLQAQGGSPSGIVGGSVPIYNTGNAAVNLAGQSTLGKGMKPTHQVGVSGSFNF